MENRLVRWSKAATNQFKAVVDYIALDSSTNAEIVRINILKKVNRLSLYAEIHPQDKWKQNNDGTYRAFEIYHFRISYRVTEKEVKILRIRHTAMQPKFY